MYATRRMWPNHVCFVGQVGIAGEISQISGCLGSVSGKEDSKVIPWGCLIFAFIAGIWYGRLTAGQAKRTGFVRRIREDGSIVVPWSVLQIANLEVDDTVELLVDDGNIVLRKKRPEET